MATAKVRDLEMAYTRSGPDGGAPVLLIHGQGQMGATRLVFIK